MPPAPGTGDDRGHLGKDGCEWVWVLSLGHENIVPLNSGTCHTTLNTLKKTQKNNSTELYTLQG